MTALCVKSLDEHRDYLHRIARLQLWFLWQWLRAHPAEAFAAALRERVDIYRKLDLNPGGINPPAPAWDDPRWLALSARAEALYRVHQEDAAAFEEAAFTLFQPQLDARAPRDFADRSGLEGYDDGSIRFDPPYQSGLSRVSIHIANAIAPRSLFVDPAYLPSCLRTVMDRAEREHGADSLETFTWLNAVPVWLALFPPSWQDHLSPPDTDIQWHYGYWGQFLTARGTFNIRRGAQFRATGVLPYLPRASWCSFTALRAHLDALGNG